MYRSCCFSKRYYFTCILGTSHTTGFEHISHTAVVDVDRIVVCGKVGEEWRMTQFSLNHGGKLRSIVLKEKPDGLASVMLGEKACLAVSYV